jgi:hypothetical protein
MAGGTKNYLVNLNLNKNELQNAAIQNLAVAPLNPGNGQIYFNTIDDTIYFWDSTKWVGTGGDITSVNGTYPIETTYGVGPTANSGDVTISIVPATSTQSGSLSAVDKLKLNSATSSNIIDSIIIRDGNGNFDANDIIVNNIDATNGTIDDIIVSNTLGSNTMIITASAGVVNQLTINNSPVVGTDAVNKSYVDATSSGLDPKMSVRVATTFDISATYSSVGGSEGSGSFNGSPTSIDGVTLVDGDRILVKDQSDPKQNGIYFIDTVSSGDWYRSSDQDGSPTSDVSSGNFTFVEQGTINENSGWVTQGEGNLTLNIDNINWIQFSGAGSIESGQGLNKSGNTLNVDLSTNSGLEMDGTSPNGKLKLSSSLDGNGLTNTAGVLSIDYGNSVGTTVEGNTQYNLGAGSGLSGDVSGNIGDGIVATFSVNLGTGLSFDGDDIISDSDLVLITATLSGVGTTDGSPIQSALEDLDTAISLINSSDIEEVVAGLGLIGGGTQGQITLDAQVTKGLVIVNDFIQLNDDVVAGNGLTASNGVIGIDNTSVGTLRHTDTGYVFGNTFTTYTITHNLNQDFIQLVGYDATTGDDVVLDVTRINTNQVQIGGRSNTSITVDVIIFG